MQPDWDHVFGSHTFHEITNYWPTRFLRTPRFKYHRNVAWQLDFPFSADLYGSLSWEAMRRERPVMIGARALRDYVRRPAEELFDLEADPGEVLNLAADPAHRARLLEYRARLEAWQRETQDPWLFRDGVSVRVLAPQMREGLTLPERFDFDPDQPD
jgi:N-sulfoglucosamine sulfohydrolase